MNYVRMIILYIEKRSQSRIKQLAIKKISRGLGIIDRELATFRLIEFDLLRQALAVRNVGDKSIGQPPNMASTTRTTMLGD